MFTKLVSKSEGDGTMSLKILISAFSCLLLICKSVVIFLKWYIHVHVILYMKEIPIFILIQLCFNYKLEDSLHEFV